MFNEKTPTSRPLSRRTLNEDAEFKGWQSTGSGEVFALYNIKAAGHPAAGSTVTDKTLRKLNLQVPDAPPSQELLKKW
jgi:hypothetical protein